MLFQELTRDGTPIRESTFTPEDKGTQGSRG